jgi:hypothetical protein
MQLKEIETFLLKKQTFLVKGQLGPIPTQLGFSSGQKHVKMGQFLSEIKTVYFLGCLSLLGIFFEIG